MSNILHVALEKYHNLEEVLQFFSSYMEKVAKRLVNHINRCQLWDISRKTRTICFIEHRNHLQRQQITSVETPSRSGRPFRWSRK